MAGGAGNQATGAWTTLDYNYTYNTTGGNYPLSPTKYACSPNCGTHDVAEINPEFVDSTRSFLNWCKSIDSALSNWPSCIARMDMNAPGFDTRYSLAGTANAAYEWIRSGWAPQNAAFRNAGHDGATIGAIEVSQ